MKPKDFLSLAESLVQEPTPASIRTAVSRSYYAVYHYARNLLTMWDVKYPEDPEDMEK